MKKFLSPVALSIVCSLSLQSVPLFAQTGEVALPTPNAVGTITVNQTSSLEGYIGNWTLLDPDSTPLNILRKKTYTNSEMVLGQYTIIIEKPTGSSMALKVTKNGTVISESNINKATFILAEGDQITIDIAYSITRTGVVSIVSDPAGVEYTLEGPNKLTQSGVTPDSLLDAPEGSYSVTMIPFEGCGKPISKSGQLKKGERLSFSVNFSCEAADDVRIDHTEKKSKFVTLSLGGEFIVFEDAPLDAWFANYVFTAAKTGIMGGYKNDDGTSNGLFGPNDSVSLAQLAKIAHEIASIDETVTMAFPVNPIAGSGSNWYQLYWASAESLHWQAFNPVPVETTASGALVFDDPNRPATRGEVVATLLQSLDIPKVWAKGNLFADVAYDAEYADSIETAASHGIIAGSVDPENSLQILFRPEDPINRAEMAKVVSLTLELVREDTPEVTGEPTQ